MHDFKFSLLVMQYPALKSFVGINVLNVNLMNVEMVFADSGNWAQWPSRKQASTQRPAHTANKQQFGIWQRLVLDSKSKV